MRAAASRLISRVKFDYVALSGGEPLLYRQLDTLVDWLSTKDQHVILTTNGALLTSGRAEKLVEAGLRSCQISLMSFDSAVHDDLAQKTSWNDAVAGLINSVSSGMETAVVFTCTAANVKDLSRTALFAAHLGASRIIINHLQIGGSAIGNSARLGLTKEVFDRAVKDSRELVSDSIDIVKVPSDEPSMGKDHARPWHRIAIDPSGLLKICNLSTAHFGPVLELSDDELDALTDALRTGRLDELRPNVDTCGCFDRRFS